jgi:hypothetical protein
MLQALQPASRGQVSTVTSKPPPVGGLNRRDALDQLGESDAIELLNLFPTASDVRSRDGHVEHSDTGETTSVKTLVELHAGTVRKLICITNGKAFDVTSSSPSTLKTGLTAGATDRWATTVFKGRLFLVNGTDAPQSYDGSTWSAPSFSGPTIANLNNVHGHKSRLYFSENNSQSFWYGATDAIAGTLTEFPLYTLGRFGGNLIAIDSITQDGGTGPGDLICFFMSSGEVIVYSGSNPGDASNFALVGVFNIGAPLGKRSVTKMGGDLAVITQDGFVPLTSVLPFGRLKDTAALSDKISDLVESSIKSFGANVGWESTIYPKGSMMLFNVPTSTTIFEQYVMNTTTASWCRFDSMNTEGWALFNDSLYFGGLDGKVYKYTGFSDDGAAIVQDAATAWDYHGERGRIKKFNNVRPMFISGSNLPVSIRLNVDFDDQLPTAVSSGQTADLGGVYDTAVYDAGIYGGGEGVRRDWQGVDGIGYASSLRFRVSSSTQAIRWNATNYTFEKGGVF